MRKFKDALGCEWGITVDYSSAIKLRDSADFDIQKVFSKADASEFFSDIFRVGAVIWTLVEDEARGKGVDEKAFAARLNGDAFEDAGLALLEEIIDFFPRARRFALKASLQKTREIDERVAARAVEMIQSGELDEKIERQIKGSTGSDSAASTPASAD